MKSSIAPASFAEINYYNARFHVAFENQMKNT